MRSSANNGEWSIYEGAMQTKAAPQRSTFEVSEDDLSIAPESHALLCRAMGAANVEDMESFRETLSPATDPLVVPTMVCGLVEETVVGVAVGAYLVEPNFGFVAYAAVAEGWRRMGVYTTLRAKLIDRLRLHGAERGRSELAYVVSEMESGYFLIRRLVGEDGAYTAPVAYEQPAAQGLVTRPLELVVRPMGVSTPPDRDQTLEIVRHIYRRIYRIRDVESDPTFIRIAESLGRSKADR